MKRTFVSLLLVAALSLPTMLMAQGGPQSNRQCLRRQNQARSSTNRQNNGAQLRQQARLRDGTGVNCPQKTTMATNTQSQAQTGTQTQNQIQTQSGTQNKVKQQEQTRTDQQTQSSSPK